MLTKFISVSETRFQNPETKLKNQQVSTQGLETQIGQLARMISEQPQGSLPSNTEINPREQLPAITLRDEEGLAESESKLRQKTMISSDRDEYTSSVNVSNLVAQPSLQKPLQKNVMEPRSNSCNKNRMTLEEQILQIDELDERKTQANEKPRIHDEPK
ncbi:hypothetical protein GOBAR_AA00121 [Gossypium barbadense]|uniref:Uncharacterized protein n=1 Tax=Gossypium barbadense TaxID=3634 RepID=A0A2P5YXW7_GOSBA|nr:hypothetical protein GOBAR_AA00121 [Gossypium barbadense]